MWAGWVFAPTQFLEAETGPLSSVEVGLVTWAPAKLCLKPRRACLFTPSQQLRNTTSIPPPRSGRRPPITRASGRRAAISYTLPSAAWPHSEPSPGVCLLLAPGMSQTINPIATRHQPGPHVNSDLPWRCHHRRRRLGLHYPHCALSPLLDLSSFQRPLAPPGLVLSMKTPNWAFCLAWRTWTARLSKDTVDTHMAVGNHRQFNCEWPILF